MTDHFRCGETIQVTVEGSFDEDFESLMTKAMSRAATFLPNVILRRDWEDCRPGEPTQQWFVNCAHTSVSAGGNTLAGTITFARYVEDE